MRVVNRTAWYPDAEVEAVVRRGYGPGATPGVVEVLPRSLPGDDRLGFTPFDHSRPSQLWLEPPSRYPQGRLAPSWQTELYLSASHEAFHYRHPGPCPHGQCEHDAERTALGHLHSARGDRGLRRLGVLAR